MSIRNITITFFIFFTCLVFVYFFFLVPEKYTQEDLYEKIMKRGVLLVGVTTDAKPFGYKDEQGNLCGYDIDLAQNVAQYLLKSRNAVKFVPVTSADRIIKASTGEVDIVIATMTITPQRKEILDFSIPYDVAGQAILVPTQSKITSIADLSGTNIGVIFGTTAEKNMRNLVPSAKLIGYKTYDAAYRALKKGVISAITSDDTILKRFDIEDSSVKLLPKRYSREPYGIAFQKGENSLKLKAELDYAIGDMQQKNIIKRLRKKWGLSD